MTSPVREREKREKRDEFQEQARDDDTQRG
jgi:hypothetical protein